MRNLWKGITRFWTDYMPQDTTWTPNRHHSSIIPLFRNHVTQNAVAMFLPPPSPVISVPVCPLCHTPRMPRRKRHAWFWRCQNYPTCTAPTTTNPPVPENLKTLHLKQQTQAVNDRIPAKGCRHLLVKPWANGTGKGNTCQLRGTTTNDKGEITGTSKSVQRKLVTDEEKHHPNRTVEGRTELDLVQDEGRRSQEVAGRSPCGSPSSPELINRSRFPGVKQWRRWHRSRNCWRRTRKQPVNAGRPEEASAGRHQEDKSHVGKFV